MPATEKTIWFVAPGAAQPGDCWKPDETLSIASSSEHFPSMTVFHASVFTVILLTAASADADHAIDAAMAARKVSHADRNRRWRRLCCGLNIALLPS